MYFGCLAGFSIFAQQQSVGIWSNRPALRGFYVLMAFLPCAHGMLCAANLLDTFTAALHNQPQALSHQASTVPEINTVVNHFKWVEWYCNSEFKVICATHHCIYSSFFFFFFIYSNKLGFVSILTKWKPFGLHGTRLLLFISSDTLIFDNPEREMIFHEKKPINLPALHFFNLHTDRWFVSLNLLILGNPMWEMISQGKSSCIKCI